MTGKNYSVEEGDFSENWEPAYELDIDAGRNFGNHRAAAWKRIDEIKEQKRLQKLLREVYDE